MFSLLALAGTAYAGYNATQVVGSTVYTTIPCSTPTTVTWQSQTVTVGLPTTLTLSAVKSSGSGASPVATAAAATSSSPILANGASNYKVGAAAGIAAAVAYMI